MNIVELMFYILPVLLSDLTSLDNDKLLYILIKLTSADNSYISLAKSMLTGSFPGELKNKVMIF